MQSIAKKGSKLRLSKLRAVSSAILFLVGLILLGSGFASQKSVPLPSSSTNSGSVQAKNLAPTLDFSRPVSVIIPAIDVQSGLIEVGKNPNGTMQVPSGAHIDTAAWYKYSPSPGQAGASVIVGHVDSNDTSTSVFFNLGKLTPKDIVKVSRADGSTAIFEVNAIREYSQANFPTQAVYGGSDNAELRLITCGGHFDRDTGHYTANTVVFATLISSYNQLELEEV